MNPTNMNPINSFYFSNPCIFTPLVCGYCLVRYPCMDLPWAGVIFQIQVFIIPVAEPPSCISVTQCEKIMQGQI